VLMSTIQTQYRRHCHTKNGWRTHYNTSFYVRCVYCST